MVTGTTSIANPPFAFATVPGLTAQIDVPENSLVMLITDGGVQINSALQTAFATVDVGFSIDGSNPATDPTPAGFRRIQVFNSAAATGVIGNWSFTRVQALSAGTHTIEVQARLVLGGPVLVSGDAGSVTQGQLTILILKP
jgi:hypothetical protein